MTENKRIYDAFTFFNELDLLEVRLHELYDVVDAFVLCEATRTFRGEPKPLVFQQNRARFSQYLDKIVHVVVDDMPETDGQWAREYFQRRALARGLGDARPEDIVIIADADEFVSRATAQALRKMEGFIQIVTPMFQFFINTRASVKWNKVFAFSYALLPELPDFSLVRVKQNETLEKFGSRGHRIDPGGWHFTYLGGAEKVAQKLRAYSHTGGIYDAMLQEGAIAEQLVSGHVVGGVTLTEFFEVDESFPILMRRDAERYRERGLIKSTMTRVRELERLYREAERKSVLLEKQLAVLTQRGSLP